MDKKIDYLEYLRVMAAVGVIILHVSLQNYKQLVIGTENWRVMTLIDSAMRWCVPVFIMITGALLLNRDYSVITIYKKFISRIVCCLMFWSIIYAVFLSILNSDRGGIRSFFTTMIYGPYHMWYLYMLVGLYIAYPVLKQISKSKDTLRYYLVISFVFGIVFPSTINIVSTYNTVLASSIENLVGLLNINIFVRYVFYFMLGYYISKYLKTMDSKIFLGLAIATIIITTVLTIVISERNGMLVDCFF